MYSRRNRVLLLWNHIRHTRTSTALLCTYRTWQEIPRIAAVAAEVLCCRSQALQGKNNKYIRVYIIATPAAASEDVLTKTQAQNILYSPLGDLE